jgi:hypothetical protein
VNVVVHPADVQDRDGALSLLRRARRLFPFIERIFADGGYAGRKMALVVWRTGTWKLQVVKRSAAAGWRSNVGAAHLSACYRGRDAIDWNSLIASHTPRPMPLASCSSRTML